MKYLFLLFLVTGCSNEVAILSTDSADLTIKTYEGLQCKVMIKEYLCGQGTNISQVNIRVKQQEGK